MRVGGDSKRGEESWGSSNRPKLIDEGEGSVISSSALVSMSSGTWAGLRRIWYTGRSLLGVAASESERTGDKPAHFSRSELAVAYLWVPSSYSVSACVDAEVEKD